MELYYSKQGQGPTLIILHGLYGSGDNWHSIARVLSKEFTVYLVDQRNHGKSPHSLSHNYADMSYDLKELVDKIGDSSVNIIGHSMGGKTAMTFTLEHSQFVNKLVAVDISPFSYINIDGFSNQYTFHKNILECFKNAPIKSVTSRKEIDYYFAQTIKIPEIRMFLLKNLHRNKSGEFSWKLNINAISNSLPDIIGDVPPIKDGATSFTKTLFIKGGKSPYITTNDIESIKNIFFNSSFITYENCGHWLHTEDPNRFLNDVLNHFKD